MGDRRRRAGDGRIVARNELRERTGQLEVQSQEVFKLNQHLEQRVADQVGEIERMSRLRRFLPPQVADLIVASGTEKQLEGHRREPSRAWFLRGAAYRKPERTMRVCCSWGPDPDKDQKKSHTSP